MPSAFSRAVAPRPRRFIATTAVALLVCASVATTSALANAASVPPSSIAAESVPVEAFAAAMGEYSAGEYQEEAASLPTELAAALDRDLGVDPERYLAEADAATDAVRVVEALRQRGVEIDSSRIAGTTLVVDVDSAEDRALAEAAGAVIESAPVEEFDTDSITFVPAFDVSGGDGYAWSAPGKNTSQCSIGFTGYRISDGRPTVLTAGHCVAGMTGVVSQVKQLVQSAPGASGSIGQPIGTSGESRFGGGFDGGLLTVDGAQAVQRATVVTWGGGAGAPRSSATLPVTGQSAGIVGASLCKSGSRTGWTCGTITSVDRTVDVQGNLVNSILATTCIQPGDSGGAALIGTTAVGVNSSTSSAPCGAANYVSAFFPMISAAGRASVATQFGAVWEPAFTVSAPTVTSIAVGASGAATTISGTVAHTSGSVAIHVDGAPTAAISVPVQAGRWSVDAAALAARVSEGSHRIAAITRLGSWSRSVSSTETTVAVGGAPKQVTAGLLPADYVER